MLRYKIIVAVALLLSLAPQCFAQESESSSVTAEQALRTRLSDDVWSGFFHSLSNQYYHLSQSTWYSWAAFISTFAIVAVAIGSFCLPLVINQLVTNKYWALSGLAVLIVSVCSAFIGWDTRTVEHTVLYQRWGHLVNEWRETFANMPKLTNEELALKIAALRSEQEIIEGSEPPSIDASAFSDAQDKAYRYLESYKRLQPPKRDNKPRPDAITRNWSR